MRINKRAMVFASALIGFALAGCSPAPQGSTGSLSTSEPSASTSASSASADGIPAVGGPKGAAGRVTGVFSAQQPVTDAAAQMTARANHGDPQAQAWLGQRYFNGAGVNQDYKKAVAWFRRAALQDYAPAQFGLGAMYERGQGVPQNYGNAANWYRKAAAQGFARAQNDLGSLYVHAQGVPGDDAKAAALYRKAAEQGLAIAQFNLGTMYTRGAGVPKNYTEAAQWTRKAAEQGDGPAQTNLAQMYINGKGVPHDDAKASEWLLKAAEQGVAPAQLMLGAMYAQGKGVSRDYVIARKWILLAKNGGAARADDALALLDREMSPGQVAAAELAARQWRAQQAARALPAASEPALSSAKSDLGAVSDQEVPLPVQVFEMYCYRTGASYKTIVGMAKAMKLKPIPKDLEPLVSAQKGEGHGYVVKLEKNGKGMAKGIMLAVSQRNVCSVAATGYDVESVVASVKGNYHLFPVMHDDTGLQVDQMFIPDGTSNRVSETHEKGVIGIVTGKPNTGGGAQITLSYVSPGAAKQIFR